MLNILQLPTASEADAISGTRDDVAMTPLSTAQKIADALSGFSPGGSGSLPVYTYSIGAGTVPPGTTDFTITLTEADFGRVNIIDPPSGHTWTIVPPRVDSFTTPHRMIFRNNQPAATVKIAWPANPGTSNGTDTAAGVPYEFHLAGDEEVIFDADIPSTSDWKIETGQHRVRQVLPLPSRRNLTVFGPSSSASYVNTGISAQLAQKLQTRSSVEDVEVTVSVGSQNAGDQIVLTLSRDNGTTFEHDSSEVGLATAEIIDPNQVYPVTLYASRQGTATGGLLPNCDPATWTVWARMLRFGVAGDIFYVGRSYKDQSGSSFYKLGSQWKISEWADT